MDLGFLPEDRIILHADCNSYYASVESIDHPEYKLVPMAVCGDPESRHGIILAKNELAKAYHIQTAETIWPFVNGSTPSMRATRTWWSDSASMKAFWT